MYLSTVGKNLGLRFKYNENYRYDIKDVLQYNIERISFHSKLNQMKSKEILKSAEKAFHLSKLSFKMKCTQQALYYMT